MRKLTPPVLLVLACGLALFAFAGTAQAVPLDPFVCITEGSPQPDCGIAESQTSGDLTDLGGGNAQLTITVAGPEDAVIEQVFIESASVVSGSFAGSGGLGIVSFTTDGSPGTLPGGSQPFVGFTTTLSFSSSTPPPRQGIGRHNQDDTSPQVGIFNLVYTGSFEDLEEQLRVGAHLIGFDDEGSVSVVSSAGLIPEPASALLFAVGALIVGGRSRRAR